MEKTLHTLTLGSGGQTHSYVIFSKSKFYIRNRASSGLAGIIIYLPLEGEKRIRMSCFSVNDPFLTRFRYVEKRNGILRKNRREGFEKSYVSLHGG